MEVSGSDSNDEEQNENQVSPGVYLQNTDAANQIPVIPICRDQISIDICSMFREITTNPALLIPHISLASYSNYNWRNNLYISFQISSNQ